MGRVNRLVTLSMLSLVAVTACGSNAGRAPARPAPAAARAAAKHQPEVTTPLPLVPRPRSMKTCEGALAIDRTTRIAADGSPEARAAGIQLADWLGLERLALGGREGTIELVLEQPAPPRDAAVEPPRTSEEEAYTLDVSPTRAVVKARSAAGLFFGAQTLAQLAGARRVGKKTPPLGAPPAGWSVPCVAIDDAPRFPFRAMHLDVARHFFGKDVVARWVDLLAFYRFNVFHWHLTDDQGFRFEVKRHPELTAVGGADGFYTHDDARSVVEHARTRHITVLPEIEMPGHTRALLAAHPELSCTGKKQPVPRTWGIFDDVLCAGNEGTHALLGAVLEDVASVFPSRVVHVGGDEVPKTRWSACPKCRAAMAKAGTRGKPIDADALQALFMQRVASKLAQLGRRPMVWDEALSTSLPGDAIVLAWQSRERGHEAAEQSYDVVMAPHDHLYLNIRQSRAQREAGHEGFLPWTKVYGFDPVPPGLDAAKQPKILGGEGTLWTEHVESEEQIEALVVPRIAALAEVLWSGTSATTAAQADFAERLRAQRPLLDASGIRYFIEPPVGLRDRKVFLEGDEATVRIDPPLLFADGIVRFTTDGSAPTAQSPAFEAPFAVRETTPIAAALFLANGRMSPVVRSTFVKERLRPPVSPGQITDVQCSYFEGPYRRLPDVTEERPRARARVNDLSLSAIEHAFAGKVRKEHFALACEALFDAPVDGVYRIVARADDGVRVSIDGERVLEDDGEHEPRDAEGEIALGRGQHRVHVAYFQGMEGKELTVSMQAPGAALAPLVPVMQHVDAPR